MLAANLVESGCRDQSWSDEASWRRAAHHSSHDFAQRIPLLRVPPFPGRGAVEFAVRDAGATPRILDVDIDRLIESIRVSRVGGAFWGSHPPIPESGYALVRVRDEETRAKLVLELPQTANPFIWLDFPAEPRSGGLQVAPVAGTCDPWHMLSGASRVFVDADDELALLARIAGVPTQCIGPGRFAHLSKSSQSSSLRQAFREHVVEADRYVDPFSGQPISIGVAIDYCAFWRDLIDRNRPLRGAVGFAFWKRTAVAPLLWSGASMPFLRSAAGIQKGDRIATWRSRAPKAMVTELRQKGAQLVEVEDGFIRSSGLGADCVPPLSIVVDQLGAHFDPSRPSELEKLLEHAPISEELLRRARRLRALIVSSGITKYAMGERTQAQRTAGRRYVLVPGQVEDDRAVLCGGAGLTSNLELLRRVRKDAPSAHIIYKPHPDVEAGHRVGHIADEACLGLADEIVRDEPMSALLDLADEVHVNSSLAGFEALLRGKPVTTHGVPFYAGWGLTRDLGPAIDRRTARRTVDELVAVVLLLYPRYLDPVTGLPCPAEVLVQRLSEAAGEQKDGMLVGLRRAQGRCKRRVLTAWNRIMGA